MGNMFNGCKSLTSIDLSSFDTSNVVAMSSLFDGCSSLTNLNLSNFNTSKVTNMEWMFQGCTNLIALDLSSFDTSKVTTMYVMFFQCHNLKTIYVSDLWNISNVTSASRMFEGCTSLKGAVPYDSSKTDASMANYINGYLTKKL